MSEAEGNDPFIAEASKKFIIGKVEYEYKFVAQVAELLRQGFASSGLEYDVCSGDGLMQYGRMQGLQPGRGIISDPDIIKPDIQKNGREVRYWYVGIC